MTEPLRTYRHWPHRILGYKATPDQARNLAAELVESLGPEPELWLEAGRFEIKDEPGGTHGLQALCLPMNADRFRFAIYESLNGPNPRRRTFLLCHEIAHTFFYFRRPGERPKRAMTTSSEWEETFCDSFAFAVTGFESLPDGLARKQLAA